MMLDTALVKIPAGSKGLPGGVGTTAYTLGQKADASIHEIFVMLCHLYGS